MAALSQTGTRRLAQFEDVIEAGMATFQQVGNALISIRDERLYRQDHETFEDYCRHRWNLSRKRAYDLTAAAETAALLSPMGDTPPTSERQVRPLTRLKNEPEKAQEAWSNATETAKSEGRAAPTAKHVERAVATLVTNGKAVAEKKAEDKAALAALNEELAPDGWDAEAKARDLALTDERGLLLRAIEQIVDMRSADVFIKEQPDYVDPIRFEPAREARNWLNLLIAAKEARWPTSL